MAKILVLAPHTDDGEIGCGGTVARLVEEGNTVYYAAFSTCEESVPQGFPKNILEVEVKAATKTLGVAAENLFIFKYPVRRFSEHRQDILEDMVKLNRAINPNTVFLPGSNDIHQDHYVIAQEGVRAFKKKTLLAYEMVWNNFESKQTLLVKLQKKHIEKKIAALGCYNSQKAIRDYVNAEFVFGLARVRGVQISQEYAEAFQVIRWII